jgi:hypothetical protein
VENAVGEDVIEYEEVERKECEKEPIDEDGFIGGL